MARNTIKQLLSKAAAESETLQQLRKDPAALAKRFKLSTADLKALRGADVLFTLDKNPLVQVDGTQTLEPITITVTKNGRFISGDPPPTRLEELSKEQLIKLVNRVVTDQKFAAQVRTLLRR